MRHTCALTTAMVADSVSVQHMVIPNTGVVQYRFTSNISSSVADVQFITYCLPIVTWCFTPSQPLRLYQGESKPCKWVSFLTNRIHAVV